YLTSQQPRLMLSTLFPYTTLFRSTVDFRNTVVIMTSNIGSDVIQEKAHEQSYDEMKAEVVQILTHYFRPEFLNRIDETVVFHPLGMEHIKNIAHIQLARLYERLEQRDYKNLLLYPALDYLYCVGI